MKLEERKKLFEESSLRYDPDLCEVTVVLNAQTVQRFAKGLEEFLIRADALLAAQIQEHKIVSYKIYEDRFRRFWEQLKSSKSAEQHPFVLAVGVAPVPGFIVEPNPDEGVLATLRVHCCKPTMEHVPFPVFLRSILYLLKQQEIRILPNFCQLEALWWRAQFRDLNIEQMPLRAFPAHTYDDLEEPYKVVSYLERGEVGVLVKDVTAISDAEARSKLWEEVEAAAQALLRPEETCHLVSLKQTLFEGLERDLQLASSATKPRPVLILGALLIGEDDLPMLSEGRWYYGVLRGLAQRRPEISNAILGKALIPSLAEDEVDEAFKAISSLQGIDVIAPSDAFLSTMRDRQFVTKMVQLGSESIERISEDHRQMASMTLCLSEEQAANVKHLLKSHLANCVSSYSQVEPVECVYQLNFQFFPLTRVRSDEVKAKPNDDTVPAWLGFVLREMVGMETYQHDPYWIQKRLLFPVATEAIVQSQRFLESSGMIKLDPRTKRYSQTSKSISSGAEVEGDPVLRFYKQALELAASSFEFVEPHRRYLQSHTLYLRRQDFDRLKVELEEFSRALMGEEQGTNRNQIYLFNLQLFPLAAALENP